MKEVKIENDELWSMKLLKASLNGVKILLWPLRVLDSFLMRRRVRPDGTKGIAPAEILFVIFIAGIAFSFVYGAIFKEFVDFIEDDVIIGHNVNFDFGFLSDKCRRYINYNLQNDCIDTMYLAKKLVPNSINYKLGTLANYFNVSYEGAHRGLKDVEITYEVYNCLRRLI